MKTNQKEKRYIPIPGYVGLRKDTNTGKIYVRKKINGKTYCETFDTIPEASHWKSNFHPALGNEQINPNLNAGQLPQMRINQFNTVDTNIPRKFHLNGVRDDFTFSDIWEKMLESHICTLEKSSIHTWQIRGFKFFKDLMPFRMVDINGELLDSYVKQKVSDAKKENNPRRFNFKQELKMLNAFFNWYRENYDSLFANPLLKRHFNLGVLKTKIINEEKKMTTDQVMTFLNHLKNQFWRDFAESQFFMAGRVQEPAGLQKESVFLIDRKIHIRDVSIWIKRSKFTYLKEIPKNGDKRWVYMSNRMLEIMSRRLSDISPIECSHFRESTKERLDFVFHEEGKPLTYRQIQYQYNIALKKAKLDNEFSSTHILRKAMANEVRKELGLDAAQAIGGWKSREVVEKIYTDLPTSQNEEAIERIEQIMNGLNECSESCS